MSTYKHIQHRQSYTHLGNLWKTKRSKADLLSTQMNDKVINATCQSAWYVSAFIINLSFFFLIIFD